VGEEWEVKSAVKGGLGLPITSSIHEDKRKSWGEMTQLLLLGLEKKSIDKKSGKTGSPLFGARILKE